MIREPQYISGYPLPHNVQLFEYGFEIVESGVSSAADVPLAADQLVQKVDCINNLTDNTVVSSLQVVLDAANKKGIPVFGSEV